MCCALVCPTVASIQRLPAVSVMTDINFPMKGRKGMVDWARNSEDKVVIPKGLFVSQSPGRLPIRAHRVVYRLTNQLPQSVKIVAD